MLWNVSMHLSSIDPCQNFKNYKVSTMTQNCTIGTSSTDSSCICFTLQAVIFGPHDTPFEDGTFKLTISKYLFSVFGRLLSVHDIYTEW